MWHPLRIVLATILLFPSSLAAQRQYDTWLFGLNAGIRFDSAATPVAISGQTKNWEGTSVWCDPATGNLRFYTDGMSVWRGDDSLMEGGTGLLGSESSTQSSLIVPVPGSSSLFYLFTTGSVEGNAYSAYGLQYSLIDLDANGGRGRVTLKNQTLLRPATEKLQGVRHCNGEDYWILTHEFGNNRFHAFLLTSQGISRSAVISACGPALTGANSPAGAMVVSHDGRRLAVATSTQGASFLASFDAATGIVSNAIPLKSTGWDYGFAFSPSGRYLYVSNAAGGSVDQIDLSSNDPAIISTRREAIGAGPGGGKWEYGSMRLGPDGRVYVARDGEAYLAVITHPDADGLACGFVADGFRLKEGSKSRLGLPNQVVDPQPGLVPGEIVLEGLLCVDGSVRLRAPIGTNYRWSPSDGLSCTDCAEPLASPATTTTYRLEVTAPSCEGQTATYTREVTVASERAILATHLPPDLRVYPGRSYLVPLLLDSVAAPVPTRLLQGTVHYDRSTTRFLGLADSGSLTEGWSLGNVQHDLANGIYSFTLSSPTPIALQGPGILTHFAFETYIGPSAISTIDYHLAFADSACQRFSTAGTTVQLDSLCGLSQRLIMLMPPAARIVTPTANALWSGGPLEVETFVEGSLDLEVIDVLGRRTATYQAADLPPGRHALSLAEARELPSGLYLLRLRAGGGVATSTVLLAR